MIRPVVAADGNVVARLMRAYLVDFYGRPDPGLPALEAFVAYLLGHPDAGVQWVAETDGTLTGFATCYFTYSTLRLRRVTMLNDLYVDPRWRQRGVGEALFRTCLVMVREHGWGPMTWETARDNHRAQALYRKWGGDESPWVHFEME
jgi:GNAT superfamily N-acetyltransferase